MLRGINLGKRRVKMDDLRALYGSLGLTDAKTYVQSGNVVFKSKLKDERKLASLIESGILSLNLHVLLALLQALKLSESAQQRITCVRLGLCGAV